MFLDITSIILRYMLCMKEVEMIKGRSSIDGFFFGLSHLSTLKRMLEIILFSEKGSRCFISYAKCVCNNI